MGKIRVQDLARMMGVANQDLMFKLKSIGVRVDGEDAAIDTDVIQAIVEGKKLPQPREVILRDDSAESDQAPVAARRRPLRRTPTGGLRPAGRRTMIQRVEPRIRTIEIKERPAAEKPAAPAAPATPPSPPREEARPERTAAPAATTPRPTPKPPPPPPPRAVTPAAREAHEKAEAAKRVREAIEEGPARKVRRIRKTVEREDEDLRAYQGPISEEEIERDEAATVSERGKRRARRKQEAAEQGSSLLQFKKERPQGPVTVTQGMTVREFAEKLGVKARDLIKALLARGVIATINHVLDPEMAEKLAGDLGVETIAVSFEEEVQLRHETGLEGEVEKQPRAPVVTVMGHVDHGKTTLLDAIRSTDVAGGEAGGITQHIGAYHVEANDRQIVFLDTPGHEAFTLMRARGARVTDIVVLVVAADDGVMPQTIEAIDHAKAAGVPIVVAINKVDKPNANLDRVKKELADRGLTVEDWGGETVSVPISALKKEGIDDLLEMILLTADLLDLRAAPELPAQGTVLEARKEVGRGIVATVLVEDGGLRVGDLFVSGSTWGRVRSMTDDRGGRLETAGPSTAVEVTGFNEVPSAGDAFQVVEDEAKARSIAEFRQQEQRRRELAPQPGRLSLDQLFDQIKEGEVKELPVIIKGDVHGSVEVLKDTLEKLSTDKVKVKVIHAGVGAVSTNDVILASASNALVVGFSVRPERNAAALADKEQVEIRLHTVIYELVDELKRAMTGLLEPTFEEVHRGTAEVREVFKVPKVGVIAGCHITDGVVARNALVRVVRDSRVVHEGKIASLRRFKDDVSEVRSGFDCGIGLAQFQDFKPGDELQAFVREEVAPAL